MKLDIELCRLILQKIEKEGGVNGLTWMPKIEGYPDDFVMYQQKKLMEAGYLQVKAFSGGRSRVDISFSGHGFLKQMLDDTIWGKTKEIAKKGGMSLTFETVKAIIPVAINSIINQMNNL
ncbi:DUF2513 domain-containing protein [Sphingobacterium hungaricum]|uniref:DUF2513 domain-containing protein n=1 Tax=Sphingobacterium hungaricum TaxID=2082723 RepID=A0A928USK3_9SPHI|nr:DUF2513 domain-containing protein [Sphingobacterium hungaricum]MBE8712531.1 hypothetical protein [Sphingobacterium hungaricum]